MANEITLAESTSRAMQEAENFCWRANVGIVAPEHLLAGCLKVLNASGHPGLPTDEQLESALLMAQGMSDETLTQNVMFGSAAREAINFTARLVGEAGGGEIDPLTLAYGIIRSGELNPMFFSALGTTKAAMVAVLTTGNVEPPERR